MDFNSLLFLSKLLCTVVFLLKQHCDASSGAMISYSSEVFGNFSRSVCVCVGAL